MAEGLSYLAGKSFVHRDIAARNILLDQELNCKVSILIIGEVMHGCTTNHTFKYINLYSCIASLIKLSGFGLTHDLSEEDYYTVKAGRRLHIRWTAPEVLFYKKYSTSSDVWSYGMLMYEIWSLGHKPFGDAQPRQVICIKCSCMQLCNAYWHGSYHSVCRLLSCWRNTTAGLLPLAVQGQCMPSWWTAGEEYERAGEVLSM